MPRQVLGPFEVSANVKKGETRQLVSVHEGTAERVWLFVYNTSGARNGTLRLMLGDKAFCSRVEPGESLSFALTVPPSDIPPDPKNHAPVKWQANEDGQLKFRWWLAFG